LAEQRGAYDIPGHRVGEIGFPNPIARLTALVDDGTVSRVPSQSDGHINLIAPTEATIVTPTHHDEGIGSLSCLQAYARSEFNLQTRLENALSGLGLPRCGVRR